MMETSLKIQIYPTRTTVTGRFANESFRQPSVRKRVGSIRKRPIVVSQTSYITLSAQG